MRVCRPWATDTAGTPPLQHAPHPPSISIPHHPILVTGLSVQHDAQKQTRSKFLPSFCTFLPSLLSSPPVSSYPYHFTPLPHFSLSLPPRHHISTTLFFYHFSASFHSFQPPPAFHHCFSALPPSSHLPFSIPSPLFHPFSTLLLLLSPLQHPISAASFPYRPFFLSPIKHPITLLLDLLFLDLPFPASQLHSPSP